MWNKNIEETVDRAIRGFVYTIWGGVGVSTDYNQDTKQFHLIIWDKSYKCEDKKEVVNKKVFH